ncbi:RNA exonuclease 1 homolog [Mesocricetus auratus]|uniref:RNA exonuclease 1 homolog n=1 Tax=Mesocricetus auratus TaxID=10036 RepID=A0A1U7QYY2_MESAU|nr:RNA exonuclease 1 homolog [Mesocricetus auratus]
MRLKAPKESYFLLGHFEAKKLMVLPNGDIQLSCYSSPQKRVPRSQLLVLMPFPRPTSAWQGCCPVPPWEGLHWRPQQDGRRQLCPKTLAWLSSLPCWWDPQKEEKSRGTHMASPSLANSTPAATKQTLGGGGPATEAQPPPRSSSSSFTYIVSPQQAAYSYSLFGVKKLSLAKELRDRIPDAMRQHYLGLFTEECLKFASSRPEAVEKAQAEEKEVYDQSPGKSKYLDFALHTLKKLRGLVPSAVPGLDKATLYGRLRSYLLTEEQRREHGFPFAHPEKPGSAMLYTRGGEQPWSPPPPPTHRTCCRCGAEYPVSSSGCCLCPDPCVFHWGRIRTSRVPGRGSQVRYSCCYAPTGTRGCTVAKQHVQDGRKDNLQGFAKTFPKKDWEAHAGIYALDCEMSYTTHGLELTRVTVVDTDLRVIYNTFVKPDNEIVDYNTRFSGVTEEDLANTNVRLRDVQAVLLSLFSAETILIGHSLESDLLALKFIHSTVVDTSVLFPHHRGLPYKRSLRGLISQYLNQTIQNNTGGHSSIEDARACMQLVSWKMQEDLKTSSPPPQHQTASPKSSLQQTRVYTSRHTQMPRTMKMHATTDQRPWEERGPDPRHRLQPET